MVNIIKIVMQEILWLLQVNKLLTLVTVQMTEPEIALEMHSIKPTKTLTRCSPLLDLEKDLHSLEV